MDAILRYRRAVETIYLTLLVITFVAIAAGSARVAARLMRVRDADGGIDAVGPSTVRAGRSRR